MTNTPTIAFFNNKGGVGKTSLVYHLAWAISYQQLTVLAVDLDPQSNLTSAFFSEDSLDRFWPESSGISRPTMFGAIEPLHRGTGDINDPHVERISDTLHLLIGDLALYRFEDALSREWPACMDRQERAFRVISSFWRVVQRAITDVDADIVLMDLGPNLGAINRAALIASDKIVVPLAADLFSLQGLRNLGPAVREWREGWSERVTKNPSDSLPLPAGGMEPIGYVVLQHAERMKRPVKAYERWAARIPAVYAEAVIQESNHALAFEDDSNCLSLLRHYRSLMPLAQEARKPIFDLRPADGAIGGHQAAVSDARRDFYRLADRILVRSGLGSSHNGG